MRTRMFIVLWAALSAMISTGAFATVPDLIPVQGVLADSADLPIDALTDLTFTLYDGESSSTVLWTDTFVDVDVVEGFFTVYLGDNTALDFASLITNAEVWVGITVETDPEMDRFQLATVPFAIEAQVSQQVGSLTETDINNNFVSSSSPAAGVTATQVSNWDTAYGWGDHGSAGYLTTESDPVFGASAASGIAAGDITNWDTAYVWGDHAGLYSPVSHDHDADYVNVTGDTMTGDLTVQANVMGGIGHEVDTTVDNYFFGGGSYNKIRNDYTELSAIATGRGNFIGLECTERCVDGVNCPVDNADACITEGVSNSSPYSFIGAGRSNTVNNDYGFIGSGRENHISRLYSFIGSGRNNVIKDDRSVIVGGRDNMINEYGEYGFIGGGYSHLIRSYNPSDMYNTIVGGFNSHLLNSYDAFIGGGSWNQIFYGPFSTIAGGQKNLSFEKGTTIAGGRGNHIVGEYSTIGGGWLNLIDNYSYASTIPGGMNNQIVAANNSFAGGTNARVYHDNTFVWSSSSCTYDYTTGNNMGNHGVAQNDETGGALLDQYCDHVSPCSAATNNLTESTADNQFMVRASGGVVFFSAATGTTNGVQLPAGSGAWSSLSDRNAKENINEIDGGEVLDKICDMEISTWNYLTQDDSIRHAGPMAQDFYAAFGLGESDRRLSSVDMDGIAFAAIKELKQQKDSEIAALKETIEHLVERLEDLEGKQ